MFREIKLSTIQIEAVLADYLLRADFQPKGELVAYLNDRNWTYVPFMSGELLPLAADRRVGAMKQALTTVNKSRLEVLSLLKEDQAQNVVLPAAGRRVLFYVGQFAVQGHLHVSADAPAEDLLDELHDFYAVSSASIYPLQPVATAPTEKVPLLLINRCMVQAYRVHEDS